ncbi:cytochrome c oxidase assembly factor Coa1 family protein [Lacinutrix sp. MedPE-SW]|uniref:cytochrome c oxidase assembly factor Coa1 family protein n=1 Tax=Lacinutrix sp. MedPE-SW TaxID=1860087 RepID=UPI00091423B6|nr:cytochrome c oxidase assembly factor Coa1 family protein [Lacinutrix sp. MedPE-SW]OIQ15449.1 MAG: hypothetical protein BM549_13875 [Lacinutrix sp. MedPE-SW]
METIRQKSWARRNWGWLLGGGCLGVIILFGIGIAGLIYKVSDAVTGSEPYVHAYNKAVENERVIALLGEPIEKNGLGSTSYSYKNGTSTAELTIPIKGPNDESEIIVEAEKINDEWAYYEIYVKIDGERDLIDLRDDEPSLNDF